MPSSVHFNPVMTAAGRSGAFGAGSAVVETKRNLPEPSSLVTKAMVFPSGERSKPSTSQLRLAGETTSP